MNTVESQQTKSDKPSNIEQLDSKPLPPKKPWFWALLILALTTGGIGLWRILTSQNPTSAPTITQQQRQPPRAVETVALSTGNGTRRVQLLG
ncbi:hypothetical protein Ple7327_2432 [Pleurocapsa sp. PCC 7327]|nr:hypothetical protein [Pleurocapsa sp. PCC 7327]AFY77731.1 hypothetical protein Ple7327_2432 [Pleurocapsa sp. PCC 7327]